MLLAVLITAVLITAVLITAVLMSVVAVVSALSFSSLSDVTILGKNIFDFLDFVGPNFFMLLGRKCIKSYD